MKLTSNTANLGISSQMEMRKQKNTLLAFIFNCYLVLLGLIILLPNYINLRKRKIRIFFYKSAWLARPIVSGLIGFLLGWFILAPYLHIGMKHISKPLPVIKKVVITPTPSPIKTQSTVFTGHISHYSKAGCLGCSANFTMANGETLNDDAYTIAVPPGWLPMNTMVKVTNLDNGKSIVAKVTDTGGFLKYNRIADLTLADARALETKTDTSEVEVAVIE